MNLNKLSLNINVKTLFNIFFCLVLFYIVFYCQSALASTTDTGLPWDKGIKTLLASIKGPVATGICIAGIVGVGGGLAFGGELSQFMKTAIILVAVVCLIISASSFLSTVSESDGAYIPGFVDMAQSVINR